MKQSYALYVLLCFLGFFLQTNTKMRSIMSSAKCRTSCISVNLAGKNSLHVYLNSLKPTAGPTCQEQVQWCSKLIMITQQFYKKKWHFHFRPNRLYGTYSAYRTKLFANQWSQPSFKRLVALKSDFTPSNFYDLKLACVFLKSPNLPMYTLWKANIV